MHCTVICCIVFIGFCRIVICPMQFHCAELSCIETYFISLHFIYFLIWSICSILIQPYESYCIVVNWIILQCSVPRCTELNCIASHSIASCCTLLLSFVRHCIVWYNIAWHGIFQCITFLCQTSSREMFSRGQVPKSKSNWKLSCAFIKPFRAGVSRTLGCFLTANRTVAVICFSWIRCL